MRADRIEVPGRFPALGVAAATFLVAFFVRIANFESAFVGGVPQLSPFDEMYHAKRIVYSAAHPFQVLGFDPNRGTSGSFCPWPPLYDMLAGVTSRLLGGLAPAEIVARASWFPPIVASLVAAFVAGWLGRRFDPATGLLGGLGVALSTMFLDRSRLAAIDHHFLEFPLVLGIVAAVSGLRSATTRRETVRYGGLFAIAIMLALLVQTALLLAAGIAFLVVLSFDRRMELPRAAAACGFAAAAVLVFLYGWSQPPGYPDKEWYLGVPHAAALAAAAAGCAAQARALKKGLSFASSTVCCLAVGVLVVASVPNAFEALLGGSQFLGGDPWLGSIAEFQPLFSRPESLWAADLAFLGGGFFLAVATLVTRPWRQGRRAVLLTFALVYSLAAISSMRFLSISAPLCAIAGAVAVHDVRREGRVALARAAAVVLVAPALILSAGRVIRPAPAITPDMVPMVRAAEFLRRSPLAGRVLGPWSWGHLFNVVGGRGVLLDNFGSMGGLTEFENARGIILSTREKAVADFCLANGVRFVVLQDPLPYFAGHAEMSGFPRAAYERPSTSAGTEPSATRLMKATFWWRAYFEGGRERPGTGPGGAAFRRFRLARVEMEPQPSDIRSAVQVWELDPVPLPGRRD